MNEPYIIPAEDLAKLLNVTSRCITDRAIRRGVGKKIGGHWFFRESDVAQMQPRKYKREK